MNTNQNSSLLTKSSSVERLLRKCGKDEFPITKSNNFSKPNFDNMFFTNVIRCLWTKAQTCDDSPWRVVGI